MIRIPLIDQARSAIEARTDPYLVALAGIPGSGKSTLASQLAERLPNAAVLPMDGYHIPRCQLNQTALSRRGAPHTFDVHTLRHDLTCLKRSREGRFPAFDHASKDPEPGAIQITASHNIVIVEGLYLLLTEWQLAPLFDLTLFLNCDLEVAMERVAQRHVQSGIANDLDEARERVATNDRLNALTILENGCRERADRVLS